LIGRALFVAGVLAALTGFVLLSPGRAAREGRALTLRLEPPLPATPLPGVIGPASAPLIVIDPGHGAHDSGARSATGEQEKDLTLALAHSIRDALIAGGKVRIALTREDDRFLILQERSDMARRLGAALFLSLHADSAGENDAARGATLYTLSDEASDVEAAALATRENRADIVKGVNLSGRPDEVASILIDLAQRESQEEAVAFARRLHREAASALPFRADYLRKAALVVLKVPEVPSVLFETGYITNKADRGLLASADGRARVGQAVARAVERHLVPRTASAWAVPKL
jgi:N-acetylmuramoyl-L-alanine amidase